MAFASNRTTSPRCIHLALKAPPHNGEPHNATSLIATRTSKTSATPQYHPKTMTETKALSFDTLTRLAIEAGLMEPRDTMSNLPAEYAGSICIFAELVAAEVRKTDGAAPQQAAPAVAEKFLESPDVQDESGLNTYYSRELVLGCIEAALSRAAPQQEVQERVPSAAGADDLQETLDRLDSKELAAWVDRGMALAENVAMYVQADCTLRAGQARDILRGHLFSAQPSPTPQADSAPASHGQAPSRVLHLVQDAFAEVAMAYPKAFALHKVGIADTAVRGALAAPQQEVPENPPMPEQWHVVVSVHGENILCMGHNSISGKELDSAEENAVIGAAQHLLSFVGYGLPPSSFDPDEDDAHPAPQQEVQEPFTLYPGCSRWGFKGDTAQPVPSGDVEDAARKEGNKP